MHPRKCSVGFRLTGSDILGYLSQAKIVWSFCESLSYNDVGTPSYEDEFLSSVPPPVENAPSDEGELLGKKIIYI